MKFCQFFPFASIFFILTFGSPALAEEPTLKDAPAPPAGFPKFKVQEIDTSLKIGYAVILADINGDKKPDIVVVDQHKIVWHENPTWKKRIILDGKTKPDNVTICAMDIDGDGLPELVVGAAWKPFDTKNAATLQWLKRGKNLDDEWTMYPIACDEPTVHRIKVADYDGDGKPDLILAPLMGRDATQAKNWMDGRPVRIMGYKIPKQPENAGDWKPTVISEELHVVHNIWAAPPKKTGDLVHKSNIYAASYEGLTNITFGRDPNGSNLMGLGDQSKPNSNRGCSELAYGRGGFSTIEPWHGNTVVTYRSKDITKPAERTVIDSQLRWGHAITMANLTGGDLDDIIVGVRDDPNPKLGDIFKERRGVRIYKNAHNDPNAEPKYERYILEDGGVAVEDLTVGDLNGDGKPDIVAVGRATLNARIYWNMGK